MDVIIHLAFMVHRIILAKLKSDVPVSRIEEMMVESRIKLLKIPEIMNLRCGKRIHATRNPHHFFVSMDIENLSKARVVEDNAIFLQFRQLVLEPNVVETVVLDYEMEPGKDVSYS